MTEEESRREAIKHYQELITDYKQNIISRLENNLRNPLVSPPKRKGYSGLLQVSKTSLEECETKLTQLLTKGYTE